MIYPDYLGFYWQSLNPIPAWRQRCVDKLVELYPSARVISHNSADPYRASLSDIWRMEMASTHKRFLWVDNDIELDSPLDLTEQPGMADEYRMRHWSIVWSGDDPDVFCGKRAFDFMGDKRIALLKITGTHWTHNAAGKPIRRVYA